MSKLVSTLVYFIYFIEYLIYSMHTDNLATNTWLLASYSLYLSLFVSVCLRLSLSLCL